tara:strand:+ start:1650 stop:1850 length:201 start_codon:yes stop_codon:yes gene_type:complete
MVLGAQRDCIVMVALAPGGDMMDAGWAPDAQVASTDDTASIYDTGHTLTLRFGWGHALIRRGGVMA